MKSEGVGLSVRAISFQDFQPMWSWSTFHERYRQTDRRTDRRTTCNLNTAVCTSASRGKNGMLYHYSLCRIVYELLGVQNIDGPLQVKHWREPSTARWRLWSPSL